MNLYFDNACTSHPKPKEVGDYILMHLNEGGSYGRAGYPRIFKSSKIVEELRTTMSELLKVTRAENIVFTLNSTHAINLLLNGFRFKNGKVLVSPLEHNAVTRPLENLKKTKKIEYKTLPHHSDGLINLDELKNCSFNGIDLVVINHVSNVNGVIQPISDIKSIIGNTPIMVDASQSLGKIDVNIEEWAIDYLVFTGHKGLLGPTGTGGFYVKDPESIDNSVFGGTGSNSESYEMPSFMPDRFQPGTPNVNGLYGLLGALKHRPDKRWSSSKLNDLIDTLKNIEYLRVICSDFTNSQSDVLSILPQNLKVSELSTRLFKEFGIETRSGLHCSPLAHKTLGTFPHGTVRISLSPYHTNDDIEYLIRSIKAIYDR